MLRDQKVVYSGLDSEIEKRYGQMEDVEILVWMRCSHIAIIPS